MDPTLEKAFELGVPLHVAYDQWLRYTAGVPDPGRVRFERAGPSRTRVSLARSPHVEKTAKEFRDFIEKTQGLRAASRFLDSP